MIINKKIVEFFLVIYAIFYCLVWKHFLSYSDFQVLRPWAAVWISSAVIFCGISYFKKQLPFFSFFIGSIFGPLGILMILIAQKDIRVFKEHEKNQEFYRKISSELRGLSDKVYFLKQINSKGINQIDPVYRRLFYFADYFKIDLPKSAEEIKWLKDHRRDFDKFSPGYLIPPHELAEHLKNILLAFNQEYEKKFEKKYPDLQKVMEKIDMCLPELKEDKHV